MDTTPLCVFVHKVTASNRLVFGEKHSETASAAPDVEDTTSRQPGLASDLFDQV